MTFAVTHVLGVILILDLFRHYVFGLKSFPRYLLVVGGIAGLAPDLDIPISWIVSFISGQSINLHGLFTHSIFFSLLFIGAAVLFQHQKNKKWAGICYVIAAGWIIHIILDCTFGNGEKLFVWPFTHIGMCPAFSLGHLYPAIDAIILTLWLVHEEMHKKIKDYF